MDDVRFNLGFMLFGLVSRGCPLLFAGALVPLIPLLASAAIESALSSAAFEQFQFHHEGILGTSFDLVVCAVSEDEARAAERSALKEIERLRQILSTYDPQSEISRFNENSTALTCSAELIEVLDAYDVWNARSGGAFSGQLGELIRLWREAERIGAAPNRHRLAELAKSISKPGWIVDACDSSVTRLVSQPLNVDSLGKGYIINKAAAAARAAAPSVTGLLLNIGGDIFAAGRQKQGNRWRIGIANPQDSADNATPSTEVALADQAISTSAAYERGYTVGGMRYSHILDPRTGFPAQGVSSATVVAPNSTTANALATTLCVLAPRDGLALVRNTAGAEALIVASDGTPFRTAGFAALEIPASGERRKANLAKPGLWPTGYRVTLTFTLRPPRGGGGGYRRPYVAVWAEDERGAHVRTIALWGKLKRYFPDLYDWSYGEKDRLDWAVTIARATRSSGRHRVIWDGRDDSGNPVPRGTYKIFIEANREHGGYSIESCEIVCGAVPATGILKGAAEFDEGVLVYGPPSSE